MEGYLLDTNAICDWLDESKPRHAAVSKKVEQAAEAQAVMVTSSIVLGEIEYGISVTGTTQSLLDFREHVIRQFVQDEQKGQRKFLLEVSRHTTPIYGELRAKLFNKFARKDRRKKAKRPEELVDPITSKELGIQENDLWIAAQAIERNLVLVTNDKMTNIREVASELKVEDWAAVAP